MPDDNDRFRCGVCGEWRFVPQLARRCEAGHQQPSPPPPPPPPVSVRTLLGVEYPQPPEERA